MQRDVLGGTALIRRPSLRFLALCLGAGLLLAACGVGAETTDPEDPDPDDAAADAASDPAAGDQIEELVVAVSQEAQAMQAQTAYKEVNNPGVRNVYEPLIQKHPETGELLPALATEWERLDEETLQLQIREGVTFHDGSPLDAEAAAYSVNHLWNPDHNFAIRETMGPQITAEAVDEFTLHVMTDGPDPLLEERLVLQAVQSMEQLFERPETEDTEAVGTGPYRFVEWQPGSHLLLERNEDWWGLEQEHYGVGDSQPPFERIRFLYRLESSVRGAMSEAGEAHITMYVTPEQCEDADADPDRQCITNPSDAYIFYRPDYQEGAHEALMDVRVREAIFLAIDEDSIVENVIVLAEPPYGQPFNDNWVGFNSDIEPFGYDPDRARELLDEARADGVPVDDLTLLVTNRQGAAPRIEETTQAVGGFIEAIGIDTDVRSEEPAVFNERVTTKPTDGRAFMPVHPSQDPLQDMATPFLAAARSTHVLSVYDNPEFDEQLLAATRLSGDERDAALQEIVAFNREQHILGSVGTLSFAWVIPEGWDWPITPQHRFEIVQFTTGQ